MESYKKIIGILFLGCAAGNVQALQQLARLSRPAATAARQALQTKPKIRPVNPTLHPQIKTVHNNSASLAPLAAQKKGQEQQKKSWNNAWAALGVTGVAATTYALQKEPVLCEGAKTPINPATFDYALLEDIDYWKLEELIKSIPTSTWGYLFSGYNPRADFCKKSLNSHIDNKIGKLDSSALDRLFKQLPDKQKHEYYLKIINAYIINNKIEKLDSSALDRLFKQLPDKQKQEYYPKIINCCIDNNKIGKLDYWFLNTLFKQLPDKQQQEYSLKILNSYINNNKVEKLDRLVLDTLFKQLPDKQKQEYSFKILNSYINNNKVGKLDSLVLYKLFEHLDTEQKQKYFLEKINSFIDNKIEKLDHWDLDTLFKQLSDKQKQEYSFKILNSCINNNKIEKLERWDLNRLFEHLNTEQKKEYSLKILNYYIDNNTIKQLSYYTLSNLFKHLNTKQKQEYSLKIVNYFIDNNTIEQIDSSILLELVVNINVPVERIKDFPFALTSLLNFSEEECPTTQHINKHYPQILKTLEGPSLQIPEIKELCIEMINYSGQEQEKGSVTFLHGQSWNWSLYETFYRKLQQQRGQNIFDDFMYFRYDKSSLISEKKATTIAKTGVIDYTKERFGILFCNLAFMANGIGSNSIAYVTENSDQSTIHQRNEQEILNLFKDSGLYEAAQKVHYSHKALFDQAEELHKKASLYGNFVTISIPKDLVNSLIYPTEYGGRRRKYPLTDGTRTDDVLYMAEHADLLPFESEFGIVLGPQMTDPDKAKEAGIEIKQWNAANPEIIAQRDAIIDEIIQLVIQEAEKK